MVDKKYCRIEHTPMNEQEIKTFCDMIIDCTQCKYYLTENEAHIVSPSKRESQIVPKEESKWSPTKIGAEKKKGRKEIFMALKEKKKLLFIVGTVLCFIIGGVLGGVITSLPFNNRINQLSRTYNEILQDYQDLEEEYDTLLSDYNSLFGQYQSILSVLEDPLTSPDIPTFNQVQSWLSSDDTDTYTYVDDVWMCGDYSAMLMVRAKEMNWRVRIAVMEYSLLADPNYNVDTYAGAYGHAFTFIVCSDNYLYYIEPQTDSVWYWTSVEYHFEMWQAYDFTGISDTVWGQDWLWVNYYNYFG